MPSVQQAYLQHNPLNEQPAANTRSPREGLLRQLSSIIGGPVSDQPQLSMQQLQDQPGFTGFAQRARNAGFNPEELVATRNASLHSYRTAGDKQRGLGMAMMLAPFAVWGGAAAAGAAGGGGGAGAGAAGSAGSSASGLTGVSVPSSASTMSVAGGSGAILPGAGSAAAAPASAGMSQMPALGGAAQSTGAAASAGASGGSAGSGTGAFNNMNWMDWLNVGMRGASAVSAHQQAGDAADAARAAASQAEFSPFNIFGGDLGGVRVSNDGISLVESGLQNRFGGQLESGAQQLLGQSMGQGPFGAAGLNLGALDQSLGQFGVPNATTSTGQVQQFSGLGDLLGAGRSNLAASGNARQALGNFDPNTFASTQFQRLNEIAQPAEQTEATQLLERLQGSGRLAVTEAGQQRELTELATAQERARNERLMQAVGLAGQEQDRLTQQATAFGGLGQGMLGQAGNLQQAGQELALGNQQQAFNQRMQGQQFGTQTALSRFGAAQEALRAGQQQRQQGIGQGLTMLQQVQSMNQTPFQLLGQSIGAGSAGANASLGQANIMSDAAFNEANANAQFFSGLASAGDSVMSGAFDNGDEE